MALQSSLDVPGCAGVNRADFSIDGRSLLTGEFGEIDFIARKVVGYLDEAKGAAQDIRISPSAVFFVADVKAAGVHVIDGDRFVKIGFIPTGVGAYGLYPSRDGTKLYVANRGTDKVYSAPRPKGSVSVIDFAIRKVVATWPTIGGGSPDMGIWAT